MVLWKQCHDPYISLHPVSSPSILPVIFSPPGSPVSLHISVYLPTHGQDNKFLEDLSSLDVCLGELLEQYPHAPIFLRGDFNVNIRNNKRFDLLKHFCNKFRLAEAPILHKTYHHFTVNGKSDSNLDKILFSETLSHPETLQKIHCKLEDPAVDSHHDLLVSEFNLPIVIATEASEGNITAPRVVNTRVKIVWSDDGIEHYQQIVVPELQRIQDLWLQPANSSKTSLSLLCESTNNILSECACITNKSVNLAKKFSPKPKPTPLPIRKSANLLLKKHKGIKRTVERASPDVDQLRSDLACARSAHRKLLRKNKADEAIIRDSSASEILSSDPS